jgi:photosystem II PsbT protein
VKQESHKAQCCENVKVNRYAEACEMESVAYILILTLALGTLFFAIAFREPPRIEKKD